MVINCVPTAERRGEMLVGYRKHLKPGGHLFLMLPLLCLTKSSRTTRASFVDTLTKVGFRIREARDSPKVAFFCLTAVPMEGLEVPREGVGLPAKGKGAGEGKATGRNSLSSGAGAGKAGTRNRRHRGGNDFAVTVQ